MTVLPSMVASSATLPSRKLASGSTTWRTGRGNRPLTVGFARLPEIEAVIATVPDSCVPRSARKRLASASGARPLIVMFVLRHRRGQHARSPPASTRPGHSHWPMTE